MCGISLFTFLLTDGLCILPWARRKKEALAPQDDALQTELCSLAGGEQIRGKGRLPKNSRKRTKELGVQGP